MPSNKKGKGTANTLHDSRSHIHFHKHRNHNNINLYRMQEKISFTFQNAIDERNNISPSQLMVEPISFVLSLRRSVKMRVQDVE